MIKELELIGELKQASLGEYILHTREGPQMKILPRHKTYAQFKDLEGKLVKMNVVVLEE